MNKTTRTLSVLTLAAWALGAGLVAAPPDIDKVPITLTGCVMAGQAKDSYLLTNITVDGTVPHNVYYRLDTTKGLKEQVGRRVEVQGYADLDDLDKGTLEVKTEDGKTTTAVTSERRTVTVDAPVFVGSIGSMANGSMKTDIATYKLDVKSVKRLEGNCANAAAAR